MGAGRTGFPWWLQLMQVVVALLIALLVVTQPGATIATLVLLLGVLWLAGGIFDLIGAFVDHGSVGWRVLGAVLGVLAGWLALQHPLAAGTALLTTFGYVLAAIAVGGGSVGVGRAAGGDGLGAGALGVISFVLGILLLTRPPVSLEMSILVTAFWTIEGTIVVLRGAFLRRSRSRVEG